MSRRLVAPLAALAMAGCGSSESSTTAGDHPGSGSELAAALAGTSGATSLYSFRYVGGERVLYMQVPAYEKNLTCSTFGSTNGLTRVWYAEVFVKWSAPRSSATLTPSHPFLDAYVNVVRADAKARSHFIVFATGGTVSLESAPVDEQDQNAGTKVRAHLDFTLPRIPSAEQSCAGFASEAGTSQQCTCVSLEGVTSSCTKEGVDSCCETARADDERFSIDVSAEPCGLLCTTTPGDPNSCGVLR